MKAIRYYRPHSGDYTTRLAGRIQKVCESFGACLYSFKENDFMPMESLFSYLRHLEWLSRSDSESDYKSEYAEESVVILCLKEENNELLQEIFDILKEYEKRYIERGTPQELSNYGHPEFIEIQIQNN